MYKACPGSRTRCPGASKLACPAHVDDGKPRCENTAKEVLIPYMQPLSQKFCLLVKDGCSMTKENATTALGTFVEKIGEM